MPSTDAQTPPSRTGEPTEGKLYAAFAIPPKQEEAQANPAVATIHEISDGPRVVAEQQQPGGRPADTAGFAVIDFETTGLSANTHDRIVEVAVVHVDRHGTVTGAWETLVNPGRDVGATHIHGITAAAILDAPTFEQIAPRLVELLSGRVIVAHNASFDTRFLLAELSRLQYAPTGDLPSLCTMKLAKEFLPGSRRRLSDCCAAFDIEIDGAHRAFADALATAKLLGAYMQMNGDTEYWNGLIDGAAEVGWPPLAVVEADWVAREVATAEQPTFLERIATRMPDHSGPDAHREYLSLLDNALLDRRISVHERNALVELASELGIGRDKAAELHATYFDDVVNVAWEDGVLTQEELADIILVGGLLGIPADSITAATAKRAPAPRPASAALGRLTLEPGDRLVLTGEMSRGREEWYAELVSRGFEPWPAVTKKVKLVVAADPDSLSGKARKARDYGIPIVDEAGLSALLAVSAI